MRCFGAGSFGQLGSGNFNPSTTPVEVIGAYEADMSIAESPAAAALGLTGVFLYNLFFFGALELLDRGVGLVQQREEVLRARRPALGEQE